MARKGRKPKASATVQTFARVVAVLSECPLTHDEVRTLERIESRRLEAEQDQRIAISEEQKRKAYAKGAKAGEEALALMERVSARREAQWSASALAEIDALAKLRGEDLDGEKAGCRLRPSPLVRLERARLIDREEAAAGAMYGACFQRLYGGKTGNGTGSGDLDPLETRIADLKRLDEARGYAISEVGGRKLAPTGLGGDARLISLCDRVLGAEESLREVFGGARQRKMAMARFKRALGLLAIHYGLRKTREDELKAA